MEYFFAGFILFFFYCVVCPFEHSYYEYGDAYFFEVCDGTIFFYVACALEFLPYSCDCGLGGLDFLGYVLVGHPAVF